MCAEIIKLANCLEILKKKEKRADKCAEIIKLANCPEIVKENEFSFFSIKKEERKSVLK